MNIAILGSGNVGSALAPGLVRAGHNVRFGVRDLTSAKSIMAGTKAAGVLSVRSATPAPRRM